MGRRLAAVCGPVLIIALVGGCAKKSAAANCDIDKGACLETASGGASIFFDISPKPVTAMSAEVCTVSIREGDSPVEGAAVTLSFSMPGMYMGPNTETLAPKGNGRYESQCVIVRCPSGGNTWKARVTVQCPDGSRMNGSFIFKVHPGKAHG